MSNVMRKAYNKGEEVDHRNTPSLSQQGGNILIRGGSDVQSGRVTDQDHRE